jgi:2OG-Fe(II) oxygenase superfamily
LRGKSAFHKIDTMEATSTAVANGAHWSSDLHQFLDTVEPVGSFATFGVLKASMPLSHPKVTVSGVGTLALPLTDQTVEALKVEAIKAPFGQGAVMRYNESVRQAWQIGASKVTLEGGDEYLQSVVVQSCQELGFSSERTAQLGIHARFYKLLYYETGGHFTAHRDTEKEAGMFGTLIIQLPSSFTGGAFSVSHQGETKTFVQETDSEKDCKYISFYSDCEHQLHPVTSGVRLCLVFNLICVAPTAPTHAINIDTETKLQAMAGDWIADKSARVSLRYGLGHQYTPQSFGIDSLKGRDDVVFQTLLNAKSTNGKPLFKIHLVLMERYCHANQDVLIARLYHKPEGGVKGECYGKYCKDASTGWYVAWHEPKNATIKAYEVGYDDGFGDINDTDDEDGYEYGYMPPFELFGGDQGDHKSDGEEDAPSAAKPNSKNMKGSQGNDVSQEERKYYEAAIVVSPSMKASRRSYFSYQYGGDY